MEKAIKWLEALILSSLAIFAPIKGLLNATGIMILIDLISGIWAAKKRNEPITSAGLRRTISKLFVYEAAIISAFIAEQYVSDILPFVKMVSAMVSLVELKSIYENLNEISGSNLMVGIITKLGSENIKTGKEGENK